MINRLPLLAVLVLLTGCESTTTPMTSVALPTGGASVSAATTAADYRVAAYDILDVSVFQVKDLDRTVQVTAAGTITLPLIGETRAAGMTTKEIEANLRAKLAERYLQNPLVSVTIKTAGGQSITVDGAVTKPGVFPLTGTVTLLQAVALGGGLNDVGSRSAVTITRLAGEGRSMTSYDLDQIQKGAVPDPILIAGDVVTVPESTAKTTMRDAGRVFAPVATAIGTVKPW